MVEICVGRTVLVVMEDGIEGNGPEDVKLIKSIEKINAKPSSSSPTTAFNVHRSCKASAACTTTPAHYPATFNRFDCLIQSPIMC